MERNKQYRLFIVLAFVLPLFSFAPLEIYLNNINEFSARFWHLVLLFLGLSTVLIAAFYMVGCRWPKAVLPVLAFLAVAAFLESRIFFPLAGHRPFTGEPIDWSQFSFLSIVELVALVVLAVVFLLLRRRLQVFYAAALFMLVFHGLNFSYITVSKYGPVGRSSPMQKSDTDVFENFYRLSKERNIIHIVTDGTSGGFMYDILEEDWKHYSQLFDGFTLFRRAAGRFPGTYPSVPFYMTGRSLTPKQDSIASMPFTHEYIRTVLEQHSIVNALAQKGFVAYGFQINGLYCQGAYTHCTGENIFTGRRLNDKILTNTFSSSLLLLDIGLFQNTPLVIRQRVFNDQKWFLTRLVNSPRLPGVLGIFTEKVTAEGHTSSYNYIHHMGGHLPIEFDENCSYVGPQEWNAENTRAQLTCVLRQLELLLKRLKQLNVYDETMVLIHADHGTGHLASLITSVTGSVVDPHRIAASNPLLLIKPMDSRGPLKISDAPASIGDVPATINEVFRLGGEFPGIPLTRIERLVEREREYIWYRPGPVFQKQALPQVRRYRIRGDVLNQYDWIPPHLAKLETAPSQLPVDYENFAQFAQGFSRLSEKRTARWVDGKLARVYLSFPTEGRTQLVFNAYVPPTILGQALEVSINDRVMGKLTYEELTLTRRHVIPVPDDVSRKQVNVIEFKMSKAVNSPPDRRHRSIIFSYIGLEAIS